LVADVKLEAALR
jgi:hypothetical protein